MSITAMPAFICITCGTQFAPSVKAPERCPICDEDRQYVPPSGQAWTTHDALERSHFNCFRQHEKDLIGIGTVPMLAIGQRALLLTTDKGNVLWDCISLLDQATVAIVKALGGLIGIAISHPHYYASMVEWAHAFDVPVYLHAGDRQWVMRPDPAIKFWDGDTLPLADGVTLIRCGGHFAGGTVLHWAKGAAGRGALVVRRHRAGPAEPSFRQLHAQLSEFLSTGGAGGGTDRRAAGTLPLRHHLRRLV